MFEKEIALEKSRLGELLFKKGLVSREQLDRALQSQRESGKKLGEVLLEWGWISERQLHRALTRQKSYRYAVAFAAAVTAPVTPFLTAAAATVDEPASAAMVVNSQRGGMRALDDESLSEVSGQGGINVSTVVTAQSATPTTGTLAAAANSVQLVHAGSINQLEQALTPGHSTNAVSMAINAIKAVVPLQADVQINGMTFATHTATQGATAGSSGSDSSSSSTDATGGLPFQVDANGGVSVNVAVPTHIDSIVFNNIQVAGQAAGSPAMGDLALVGVDMHNTMVKVTVR